MGNEPNMIASHPELFWGLVASMWVGNCFLPILNVPLVRYRLSVLKIPYSVLFPCGVRAGRDGNSEAWGSVTSPPDARRRVPRRML
jgi:TctA family transporter